MINFKPVRTEDKEALVPYINKSGFVNSECSFTIMRAWQEACNIEYAFAEGALCVKWTDVNGKEGFYFPMGDDEAAKAAIYAIAAERGGKITLTGQSEQALDKLRKFGISAEITPRRDTFDYVYERERLVTLAGKKLHGKKNHFNHFIANYDYEMREVTEDGIGLCERLLERVIEDRSSDSERELKSTLFMLRERERLGLRGELLIASGDPVGLILGQEHRGYALLHVARCDVSVRGASVALFKFFLERNFSGLQYVNFMEDMGIEGLRKAKLSYCPAFFIEKSDARISI
ncbi:MAG: phosphatidylglycerol lysyltransferase domain-containing protein [Clostridiales bacterium]|jgi:hypothetical protein|nr:phosphatidylglycerol lysyltransferase domain-containing protein [Clostridiales bacterium]